ncbi:MAG: class I SAM-dependent methyltransferase [Dehalococcoidia bacterium]|nr:class I SAM-dependent methyltransferase [Dehalococcoidia bacterium]
MELESQTLEMLQQIGIRRGHTVLDFGCGSGTYTVPVAKIVGEQGRVHALDKDKETLDELVQKAESAGLKNIKRMETSGKLEINLADESVDVVLLFDVFHSYYFPQANDRRRLLDEIHRIMKPTAFVSVWPKHMESPAKDEIESANFYLESEYTGALTHNNHDREKGQILNFKKKLMRKKRRREERQVIRSK